MSTETSLYWYDVENRLVAAYRPEGTLVAALKYDPLGRLYEVSDGTQAGTTRFVHDGVNIALEYNTANQVLRRYMWGPEADEPILWDEGSAMNCTGTRFLLRDRLGSIVAGADCGGSRVFANRYDEYGLPQRANPATGQPANSGRFQYTGQAWLPELGLYYYKARMYSPSLGRFMQTDPIGYGDGLNMYNYVKADPVNWTDPTGMFGQCSTVYEFVPKRNSPSPAPDPDSPNDPGDIVAEAAGRYVAREMCQSLFFGLGELGLPSGPEFPLGDTPKETDTCATMRKKAEAAKKLLPKRVTADRVWSDRSALEFYRLTYLNNAWDIKWWAGPGASTLAGAAASRGGPVSGTTSGLIVGAAMTAWNDKYDKMANAIADRQSYLKAVADGTCP